MSRQNKESADKDLRFPRKTLEKNKQPEGLMGHCQTFCGSPKKKGAERTFEEIMIENFPKLIKDMNINIQAHHMRNSQRPKSRYIISKVQKTRRENLESI